MHKIDSHLGYQLHHWHAKGTEERAAHAPEDHVRISVHFTGDLERIQRAGFVLRYVVGEIALGSADLADIEQIAALDEVISLHGDRPVHLHLNTSVPEIEANLMWTPPVSLDGTGVIVGIVDTGIDIFHGAFRKSDANHSTRILTIWDQTLTPQAGEHSPAAPLNYGVEFTEAQINAGLTSVGQNFRHQDTHEHGHGTHVASIAAGNGLQTDFFRHEVTYIGVAPNADLVIVKTDHSSQGIIDGIAYIFQYVRARAAATGRTWIPAVVNVSLGNDQGAHDGTDHQDQALDGLVGPGRIIITGAGNTGNRNTHVSGHISGGASQTLRFRVEPGDQGDEFEIWYSGDAGLRFTLQSPLSGTAYGPITPPFSVGNLTGPAGGDIVTAESTINEPQNGKNRINFKIQPTPSNTEITTGIWTITLEQLRSTDIVFDIWIRWKGRDSADATARFIEGSTKEHTVDSPATAARVIAVGAYSISGIGEVDPDPSLHNLAAYSSRGPTVAAPAQHLPERTKPDICAPGIGIWSATSSASPEGTLYRLANSFYAPFEGTSAAAPFVTGVVALLLQEDPFLTYDQIIDYLRRGARPVEGLAQPNNDWGWGKVDALRAWALLSGESSPHRGTP